MRRQIWISIHCAVLWYIQFLYKFIITMQLFENVVTMGQQYSKEKYFYTLNEQWLFHDYIDLHYNICVKFFSRMIDDKTVHTVYVFMLCINHFWKLTKELVKKSFTNIKIMNEIENQILTKTLFRKPSLGQHYLPRGRIIILFIIAHGYLLADFASLNVIFSPDILT